MLPPARSFLLSHQSRVDLSRSFDACCLRSCTCMGNLYAKMVVSTAFITSYAGSWTDGASCSAAGTGALTVPNNMPMCWVCGGQPVVKPGAHSAETCRHAPSLSRVCGCVQSAGRLLLAPSTRIAAVGPLLSLPAPCACTAWTVCPTLNRRQAQGALLVVRQAVPDCQTPWLDC